MTCSRALFGAAFICLVRWLRADAPGVWLGTATGLALAATYLTKISNLPLLAVSGAVMLFKISRLAKAGKLRAAFRRWRRWLCARACPSAAGWRGQNATSAISPARRRKFSFSLDAQIVRRMVAAPDFHAARFMDLVSGLMATFWQGEFLWHRQPLASPVVDTVYAISSVCFVGVAVVALLSRSTGVTGSHGSAMVGILVFCGGDGVSGFLSIIYDFQDCFYPSRAHPYFTSGRLMLGALIPFLLLYLYGMDCALSRIKNRWTKPLALACLILFMLISEITINRMMFSNAYNWFHM